jgi:DNA-directed RNA polymerase subunit RPC12/RpoP
VQDRARRGVNHGHRRYEGSKEEEVSTSTADQLLTLRRAADNEPVHFAHNCPSHPSALSRSSSHECLRDEMRCAYCGHRIHPYPCNGCGKFLTAREMHENESRCDECV